MIKNILELKHTFFLNYQKSISFPTTFSQVKNILSKPEISEKEFLDLLFSKDDLSLELIAKKSKSITEKYFGKVILFYVPLYISNYCVNKCTYCGYSNINKNVERKKLKENEIDLEMQVLKKKGFDTILILTGDDKKNSSLKYLSTTIEIAKKYFTEILIETYAMTYEEYKHLVNKGLTGVTIYQETYDEKLYDKLHLEGPKKDFDFRLESPERAIKSGVKEISIGCLLGLNSNFLYDVYMTVCHADYLQKNYPEVEVSISYPRLQPAIGVKNVTTNVSDKDFVKIICATRIFLSRVGINLSTREKAYMRDNLIGLGITRMSAGSKTSVGGYKYENLPNQFEISDNRSVYEIERVIWQKGYEPVFDAPQARDSSFSPQAPAQGLHRERALTL
ncbi:MAG: 2-iminoacetate synthase ThiH, partial [Endomicrobiia bacterium]